jgi:fluoride ion exporter CrcB/FEX
MAVTEHHGMDEAQELAGLNLADKPDGPAAAAMVAAGIGIFVLGLLTTLAVPWTDLKGFLADFQLRQGVGPLAGKTTLAVIAFVVSWGALHYSWREKDLDLKKMFYIGLVLGLLGALGTFPPFFERF